MSVSLSPIGNGFQFFTATGAVLNGGLLFTYQAGTSTAQATYTDPTAGTPNSNPIVLNSDGRPPEEIWLTDGTGYKFLLKDSLGNLIATYDNLFGIVAANNALFTGVPIYVSSVSGTGNALVLTPSTAITAYTAGQIFTFSMSGVASNTGGSTVAVSGLAAKTIYSKAGATLTGDELRSNGVYMIEYSSTLAGFVLINSDQPQAQPVTFTPSLAFGGSSVGITYSVASGQYLKLGNIVFFAAALVLTSKGAQVGIATVKGFPYAINASFLSANSPTGQLTMNQVTFADKYACLAPLVGTTTMQIATTPGGGGAGPNFLTDAAFVNTSGLFCTGFYFV